MPERHGKPYGGLCFHSLVSQLNDLVRGCLFNLYYNKHILL
ncbi:hypothetical protein SDJN02_07046, partial [Cucurbita argyrosperma subsp. argyrosperma]